jgi:hypothetical protein
MSSRLTEATVDLITQALKAGFPQALADVRSDRADARVSTESIKSWHISDRDVGLQCPAVFVLCDDFDFKKSEFKANHVNAIARVDIRIVLEDQDSTILTRRTWRYMSAARDILDQNELTSSDGQVKLVTVITRARYSPLLVKEASPEGPFRKEVLLELEVNHWEGV